MLVVLSNKHEESDRFYTVPSEMSFNPQPAALLILLLASRLDSLLTRGHPGRWGPFLPNPSRFF